jgi:hypothetical protein
MFKLYNTEQGIYQSLVNETADIFCMFFDVSNKKYPIDLIQSSFDREVKYLYKLKKYKWCPEVIEIKENKIYLKWYNNDCRHQLPQNFEDQLLQIALDLHKEKIYKPSFYPKYFYVDNNDIMRCFNFYTACNYNEQPIDVNFYKPIFNEDRLKLINQISVDNKLDVKILIKHAFNDYIKWPNDVLPKIYKKVYD